MLWATCAGLGRERVAAALGDPGPRSVADAAEDKCIMGLSMFDLWEDRGSFRPWLGGRPTTEATVLTVGAISGFSGHHKKGRGRR